MQPYFQLGSRNTHSIYSATHKYSVADNLFTFMSFIGLSVLRFLIALVLMVVSVSGLGISVGGLFSRAYEDAPWSWAKFVDFLQHLWIPVMIVGLSDTASLVRMMRGNLSDILNMQYVQTARAKGLSERLVIYKHAVRNAIHPLIMSLGMSMPGIISGSTVVSIVLSLPTVGPLYFNALRAQDMFLAGTVLMFMAIMLVIGNFLADIALALVDPRIATSKEVCIMPDTAVNLDASPAVPIDQNAPLTTAVNLAPLSAESLSGSRRNILIIFYVTMVIFPGFSARTAMWSSEDYMSAPPQLPRWFDENGKFHRRPSSTDLPLNWTWRDLNGYIQSIHPEIPYLLHHPGEEYRLLGFIPCNPPLRC